MEAGGGWSREAAGWRGPFAMHARGRFLAQRGPISHPRKRAAPPAHVLLMQGAPEAERTLQRQRAMAWHGMACEACEAGMSLGVNSHVQCSAKLCWNSYEGGGRHVALVSHDARCSAVSP